MRTFDGTESDDEREEAALARAEAAHIARLAKMHGASPHKSEYSATRVSARPTDVPVVRIEDDPESVAWELSASFDQTSKPPWQERLRVAEERRAAKAAAWEEEVRERADAKRTNDRLIAEAEAEPEAPRRKRTTREAATPAAAPALGARRPEEPPAQTIAVGDGGLAGDDRQHTEHVARERRTGRDAADVRLDVAVESGEEFAPGVGSIGPARRRIDGPRRRDRRRRRPLAEEVDRRRLRPGRHRAVPGGSVARDPRGCRRRGLAAANSRSPPHRAQGARLSACCPRTRLERRGSWVQARSARRRNASGAAAAADGSRSRAEGARRPPGRRQERQPRGRASAAGEGRGPAALVGHGAPRVGGPAGDQAADGASCTRTPPTPPRAKPPPTPPRSPARGTAGG